MPSSKHSFRTSSLLGACALALMPGAQAQTSPWSVRLGPAAVNFSAKSSVEVAGAVVPGGELAVKDNTTVALEIGYAIDDRWTTRLAIGVPPTTTLSAGGTLTGFVPPLTGTLGKIKYGPGVLSLTYKLGDFASFKPYVGAGVNYTWVISASDGDVSGLKAKSAWGTVLEAGFDVPLSPNWSLFLDVRKIFVKTSATGTLPALGGPPAKANLTLDPLITHLGVGYRF
jgi:outer membrane protein